jgi:hypothetical protein
MSTKSQGVQKRARKVNECKKSTKSQGVKSTKIKEDIIQPFLSHELQLYTLYTYLNSYILKHLANLSHLGLVLGLD